MRSICLSFKIHQPVRLRRYRFFEIGDIDSEYYYNDYSDEKNFIHLSENCYLPTNKIILDLIEKNQGRFKVAFSISGTTIDQIKIFTPEVIESFQKLAATGCVEFLAGTFSNSLLILKSKSEFRRQVKSHSALIESLFGKRPAVFSNTEIIYSDEFGAMVAEMGYRAMLTKGPENILKWRNPNYIYRNVYDPAFKLLLKNQQLSDDIDLRLSISHWTGWPITAGEYASKFKQIPKGEKIVNLNVDYDTFGEHQTFGSGIFKFLESLPPTIFKKSDFEFMTPSEVVEHYEAISTLRVPHPLSWPEEQRDYGTWLGNELQQEAFESLVELSENIDLCTDSDLLKDWQYLQSSDHFYYMTTKYLPIGEDENNPNPYSSPYDAFMNYMNVLNDFSVRLNREIRDHTNTSINQ